MAATAEGTSLKMTNAWPLIFSVFNATMSMICPNCEKIAYSDFFKSEEEKINH
jgi:hypothetical protein